VWERIELGYQARDMDEKWDVFVENRVGFLHRSWTGNGAFEASFSPVDGGWHISAAVAETSPERVRKVSAELNQVMLELVLCAVVLGEPAVGLRAEPVRLSSPQGRPAPPEGVIEHSLLGLRSNRRRALGFRDPRGVPAGSGAGYSSLAADLPGL
jgi:hypothetical protein